MSRIAVLMGGESQERDVSRVTGTAVAKALAERGHEVTLLDTRDGLLALGGDQAPRVGTRPPGPGEGSGDPSGSAGDSSLAPMAGRGGGLSDLASSLGGVDAVFIALHGGWGEDGTIQAFFELLGMPYTGSGVLGSALSMDKERAKRVLRSAGVPTPDWRLVEWNPGSPPAAAGVVARCAELGGDLVVKPNAEGSTVGLSLVKGGDDPVPAIEKAARFGERVLVERFVPGRELTVAILGDEALPVVEIIPDGGIYDYEAKYTKGRSAYEVPADLPSDLAGRLRRASLEAFRALGCEGFARIDWRLDPDGGFWCLESNTIPGMTPLSLVPMAAKAAGLSFGELVERIVELAITRRTRRDHPAGGGPGGDSIADRADRAETGAGGTGA